MQSFCIEERGTYKNNSGTGLKRRVDFDLVLQKQQNALPRCIPHGPNLEV